jgi:peptidyl-dipeptidase Dcp
MKKILSILLTSLLVFSSCNKTKKSMENPFFSEYNSPFQVPPFDLIDTSHYLPAYVKGIAEQQAEIDDILNNNEPPHLKIQFCIVNRGGFEEGKPGFGVLIRPILTPDARINGRSPR